MPKALAIWRDGRTRLIAVPDVVPMTVTVVERAEPTPEQRVPPVQHRTFSRAAGHRRAVIYEEPEESAT